MAITFMCIAIGAVSTIYGQQKENTLGRLWPKVEQDYAGMRAKKSAIEAARLNEYADNPETIRRNKRKENKIIKIL